jgi:exodeoxyribonuclease VII large subunit
MEKERVKITNLNARFIPSVRQNIESQSLILNSLTHKIHRDIRHSITESAKQINNTENFLTNSLTTYFSKQNLLLNFSTEKLRTKISNTFVSENHKIEKLEQQALSNDPKRLLNKGYTLTTCNNNRIDSVLQLKKGQRIKTWFKDGDIESEIL